MLPAKLVEPLRAQIASAKAVHDEDPSRGLALVVVDFADPGGRAAERARARLLGEEEVILGGQEGTTSTTSSTSPRLRGVS